MKRNPVTNNSKDRKLRYIREKNRIRKGGKVIFYEKISNLLLESNKDAAKIISDFMEKSRDRLKRDFNIEFHCFKYSLVLMGDDFANDMKTIFIHLEAA